MKWSAYRITLTLMVLLSVVASLLFIEAGIGHDGLLCELGFKVRDNADACS